MKIDFHSHILPGIDDGSRSVAESIQMLQMEAQQGITHIVATPHFYPENDSPERFLRRRERAMAALKEAMESTTGLPDISLGAEVYYFRGISQAEALTDLTIENGRYILLEVPMRTWSDSMFKEIERLYTDRDIIPIIAHIDRYISIWNAKSVMNRFGDLPVLIQANASFFNHVSTRRMALRMLSRHQIHLLGSDCHNLSGREPNLGNAFSMIEKHIGPQYNDFVNHCGESILQGETLV